MSRMRSLLLAACGLVLADTGGESIGDFSSVELLADYLDGFFAGRADLDRTIDLLILTHQHIDHTRGAERMRHRQGKRGEQMEQQLEKKRAHQEPGMISRKLRMPRNSPTSFSGSFESGLYTASN